MKPLTRRQFLLGLGALSLAPLSSILGCGSCDSDCQSRRSQRRANRRNRRFKRTGGDRVEPGDGKGWGDEK